MAKSVSTKAILGTNPNGGTVRNRNWFLTQTEAYKELQAQEKEMKAQKEALMEDMKGYVAENEKELGFVAGKCTLSNGIKLAWKKTGTKVVLDVDETDDDVIVALADQGGLKYLQTGYNKQEIAKGWDTDREFLRNCGIVGVDFTVSLIVS